MCYMSLCGLCWNKFFGPPLVRSGTSCLRMQSALQTTLCTCCGWNIYSVPPQPIFSPSGFYLLLCFGSLTCTHMYVMIWGRRYRVKNWTLNNTPLISWNWSWGRGVLQPEMGFKHATSQSWAHCPHHLDTPPPIVSALQTGTLVHFCVQKGQVLVY